MEKVDAKDYAEQRMEKPLSQGWQQGKNLVACLKEMYDKGLWTDVKFHCKDHEEGQMIQAHKIVLAARSPVFQAIFFGPCADGKSEIELKDADKDIFLLLLGYIYSDEVTLSEDNAFSVLKMAHSYQVSGLVQFCADFLVTIITPNNACEILTFATFYKLPSVKDACCSFIDNHAQEVLQTDGFMNLSDDCLLHILKGDTLYTKEEVILEAAEKWSRKKAEEKRMDNNGTTIRKLLGESFFYLRLPTMTSKTLLESTSRKGYFSVEEYADISAFTNKVPEISVTTNSCVARVPENETVIVNTQDGDLRNLESVNISFEVSVSRNVLLSGFSLGEINPCLRDSQAIYKDDGWSGRFIGEVDDRNKFDRVFDHKLYENKVIKLTTLDRQVCTNYYVTVLNRLDNLAHLDSLDLELSGSVTIRGVDGTHTFGLQQSNRGGAEVSLNKPILLKSKSTPYIVALKLRYCNWELNLKARCSESTESISNQTGSIQIRSLSGGFAGIKMIAFTNFSTREKRDMDVEACDMKSEKIVRE